MNKKLLLIIPTLIGLTACNGGGSSSSASSSASSQPTSSATSSTTSEPAHPIDLEALKRNIAGITSYQADIAIIGKNSFDTGSMKSIVGEMDSTILIDGDAYSVETSTKNTESYVMSKYAAEHNVSVEALEEMAKRSQGKAIANRETDTFITIDEEKTDSTLYKFDKTAKQSIKYITYKDNIVNAYYLARVENNYNDSYISVMNAAITKGSKDEDKGTISFTFDDAFNNSETYQSLLQGGCYASALTLSVENNYPTKLDFTIDLDLAKEMTGRELDEMNYDVSFSKINNVHLILPEGKVACDHHGLTLYSDETTHNTSCPACGMIHSAPAEHDFDENHGICKTCGFVKGLAAKDGHEEPERKTSNEVGEGLYAFSYIESEKGERYDLARFASSGEKYYEIVENKDFSYCAYEKVVISNSEPVESYLSSDSCLYLSKTEYKLYTNVEIEENEGDVTFNGKTFEEFAQTATPETSCFGYNVSVLHDTEESTETHVDDCHTVTVTHCLRCEKDVDVEIIRKHVPTNFKEITYAQFTDIFGKSIDRTSFDYHAFGEDYHYFEAECSTCHKKIYMVCTNSDGYETDHALAELAYDFYEKEGVRIATYQMNLTLEHIDDGTGHCLLCAEEVNQ